MSRILLVVLVLVATAGAVVAYGDPDRIAQARDTVSELLRKRALLLPALLEQGWTVLQAAAPAPNASAILSLYKPGSDMAAVRRKLMDARIHTSLRGDRQGRPYVRLSPSPPR